MNVKTLILGVVMGGMIAAGTYFFLPTPTGAYAQGNCVTSREPDKTLAKFFIHSAKMQVGVAENQREHLAQAVRELDEQFTVVINHVRVRPR
jgi:hypothetical protein